MGYVDFETENAIYRVELISHLQKVSHLQTVDSTLKVDAVVSEHVSADTSFYREGFMFKKPEIFIYPHMKSIDDFVRENNLPLFLETGEYNFELQKRDLPSTIPWIVINLTIAKFILNNTKNFKTSRRYFLATLGMALYTLRDWIIFAQSGEYNLREPVRKLMVQLEDIWANIKLEGRNALFAHKLETIIAPEMKKRLGRKPVLYVTMGAAHIALKECLENESYRNNLLMRFYPYEENLVTDPKVLSSVVEMIWNPKLNKWVLHILKSKNPKSELPVPSTELLKERKRISEMLERRLEVERTRPDNMPKREVQKDEPLSRREFLRRLRPRA